MSRDVTRQMKENKKPKKEEETCRIIWMLCLQTTKFYNCGCYNNFWIKNVNKEINIYH